MGSIDLSGALADPAEAMNFLSVVSATCNVCGLEYSDDEHGVDFTEVPEFLARFYFE